MKMLFLQVEFVLFNRYLNEKAQTNVTSEAKAKFLKPLDRFDAGHSLKKNMIYWFELDIILASNYRGVG